MHRLQLETMLSACLRHAEQRDNLAEKLEGSETKSPFPDCLIESATCALVVSARLEPPAHFCAPLASETQAGSGRRAQCPKTSQ